MCLGDFALETQAKSQVTGNGNVANFAMLKHFAGANSAVPNEHKKGGVELEFHNSRGLLRPRMRPSR